jgi:hypothetical protein
MLIHNTPAPPSVAEVATPSIGVDLLSPPNSPGPGDGNFSLEDMIDQSALQEDLHDLLKLIEVRVERVW